MVRGVTAGVRRSPGPASSGDRPNLPGVLEEAGDGLLLRRIAAGSVLWRIHRAELGALHFGDASVDYRFNDPGVGATHPEAPAPYPASGPDEGDYGVCYLGFAPETAFVETFLRRPARRDIALGEIRARRLTAFRVQRDLRLVQLDGPGLNRAGVDGFVVSGKDYTLSRAVSRMLWRRGDLPDGILYVARHDNHLYAAALFDRAQASLVVGPTENLDDDLLRTLIRRYRFSLL